MDKPKIVFEDDQILVMEKAAGVVVNRSATIREETLQDQLAEYFHLKPGDLGIGERAGIVHRLDRETSGLLLVAKTQAAFENLQKQFADRKVRKEYIALVHGKVKDQAGSITSSIGRIGKFGKFGLVPQPRLVATIPSRGWDSGREARTDFKVEKYYQYNFRGSTPKGVEPLQGLTKSRVRYLQNYASDYTLLRLYPKTGRTHQIRVHLKSIGHPIVSDLIYAPRKLVKFDLFWCPRLFLHAAAIEFTRPTTGDTLTFKSDLPKDLENAMLNLNQISNIKYTQSVF